MMEELGISADEEENKVKIDVTFEDELTGKTRSSFLIVSVCNSRYYIKSKGYNYYLCENFIPGKPFESTLKVYNFDGTPAKEDIESPNL